MEERIFRADLYYRLNVIPVTIPPLREHKEDIPVLTDFFLDKFCDRYSLQKKFAKRVYRTFEAYSWPGNVRELKNIVERMVIIEARFPPSPSTRFPRVCSANGFPAGPEPELDEKERIRRALKSTTDIGRKRLGI